MRTEKHTVHFFFGFHLFPKTLYTATPNDKISPWNIVDFKSVEFVESDPDVDMKREKSDYIEDWFANEI